MTTATPRQIDFIKSLRADSDLPNRDAIARNIEHTRPHAAEHAASLHLKAIHAQMEAEGIDTEDYYETDEATKIYNRRFHELYSPIHNHALVEMRARIEAYAAELAEKQQWAMTADLDTLTKEEASAIITRLNGELGILADNGTNMNPAWILPDTLSNPGFYTIEKP